MVGRGLPHFIRVLASVSVSRSWARVMPTRRFTRLYDGSSPSNLNVDAVSGPQLRELAAFARPPVIGGGERVGEVEPLVTLRRR